MVEYPPSPPPLKHILTCLESNWEPPQFLLSMHKWCFSLKKGMTILLLILFIETKLIPTYIVVIKIYIQKPFILIKSIKKRSVATKENWWIRVGTVGSINATADPPALYFIGTISFFGFRDLTALFSYRYTYDVTLRKRYVLRIVKFWIPAIDPFYSSD